MKWLKQIRGFNDFILTIIISDFFVNSAFASVAPIFAIFITRQIQGGDAAVAGFATASLWLTKGIFQLPIAKFLDRTDGENDDFKALFFGSVAMSAVPIMYLFVSLPWHLYLVQAFLGFCLSWVVPAWYALFTRHVDQFRISFEWSLDSVFSVSIATALASAFGGLVANRFGFDALFIFSSIFILVGAFLLLPLRSKIRKREFTERLFPEKRSFQKPRV